MRLSSYTRSFVQTHSWTYQWLDTNGAVDFSEGHIVIDRNNVDWSLASGGTETSANEVSCFWSPFGPPNSWGDSSSTLVVWPPAPGLGGLTNVDYRSRWVYDAELDTYSYTTTTNPPSSSTNLSQPYYPMVHVAVTSIQITTGPTNDPTFRLPETNAITETAQSRIELLTGGEPGATNVMYYSFWVFAWENTGPWINPSNIIVAGQNADVSGRIVLALAANTTTDITPNLPASYTNYNFWVPLISPWTYAVTAVAADDASPSVGSNVTFTAVMNDTGPTPPVITWFVNGVTNTTSTNMTLACAFTNAGTYTVTAQCGDSVASTAVFATFRGAIDLFAGALDIAVGDLVSLSATLTPATTPTIISWAGDAGRLLLLDLFGLPYFADFPADAAGRLDGVVRFLTAGEKSISITCDNSTTNKTIRVYEVMGLTASESTVAVGSNVTFTATLNPPGGNPPPLQWFVNGTLNTNFTGTNLTWLMTNAGPLEVKAKCGLSEVPVTVQGEFRGTINLTASTEDIGVSSNVTFTASLTPAVTAENLVWNGPQVWKILAPPSFGMMWPDFAGGFTKEFTFDYAGEYPVTVTCGTSSVSKTIRVYAVTAVTANELLVPVGSNLTFTATMVGGTNPPAPTWFVDGNSITNTGVTVTITFTNADVHTVSATCGTSSNNVAITAVGVKRIESLTPDALGVFAPSPLFVLKGNAIQFRAIPDPETAAWPPGMPTWQIEGSSLTNAEPPWSFQNQSTTTNDTKLVVAKCGTSSGTNNVTVFGISLVPEITVLANDYAGLAAADRVSRSVTRLDAQISPGVPGLQLTLAIDSATPNTTDKGEFVALVAPSPGMALPLAPFIGTTGGLSSSSPFGDNYSTYYAAKLELPNQRDRSLDELKPQIVTINVLLNQVLAASANVTVKGHFKWLMGNDRFQDALDFVNAKYSCGVSLPHYVLSLGANHAATAIVSGSVSAAKSALDHGENFTASALIHEQVHVLQGTNTRTAASLGQIVWEGVAGADANSIFVMPSIGKILTYLSCEIAAWGAEGGAAGVNWLDVKETNDILAVIEQFCLEYSAVNQRLN